MQAFSDDVLANARGKTKLIGYLYCHFCVHCAVIEGMDVVKKIESVGSGDGKPSKKVVIADSGELPSGSATS